MREGCSLAQKRIEQLFADSKAQHRGRLALVQRVRDQLDQAYNDASADAQLCLDQLFDWLDREHLEQRPAGRRLARSKASSSAAPWQGNDMLARPS